MISKEQQEINRKLRKFVGGIVNENRIPQFLQVSTLHDGDEVVLNFEDSSLPLRYSESGRFIVMQESPSARLRKNDEIDFMGADTISTGQRYKTHIYRISNILNKKLKRINYVHKFSILHSIG